MGRRRKNEFNFPFVANIPIDVEARLTEQANKEITYLEMKDAKIAKKYSDLTSPTRKVGNFVSDFFRDNPTETLSYDTISRVTGYTDAQVKGIVSELARWKHFSTVIIRTPHKKGYIQTHAKDMEETEGWITTQTRTIASREQRLDRTKIASSDTRRQRKKMNVEEKIKKKEIISEKDREDVAVNSD